MCPQKQIDPKPQVPTLILEAKVGTWSETRQRESWNLYCREKGTANTRIAPILQKKRNYNCCDRSSITNRKKLQLLQLLQYCREGNCNYYDLCNTAEREKLKLLGPLQYCRDRNCNYYDQHCREMRVRQLHDHIASRGMTPWIVEGTESHTRALTLPHASVYRRVCVGSNPPSQPAPRPPRFIGLRFVCGGGFVSGFCQGGLGHMHVPRSPNFRGNRA